MWVKFREIAIRFFEIASFYWRSEGERNDSFGNWWPFVGLFRHHRPPARRPPARPSQGVDRASFCSFCSHHTIEYTRITRALRLSSWFVPFYPSIGRLRYTRSRATAKGRVPELSKVGIGKRSTGLTRVGQAVEPGNRGAADIVAAGEFIERGQNPCSRRMAGSRPAWRAPGRGSAVRCYRWRPPPAGASPSARDTRHRSA
jgi:hypothetical protein